MPLVYWTHFVSNTLMVAVVCSLENGLVVVTRMVYSAAGGTRTFMYWYLVHEPQYMYSDSNGP